ncbi:FAD-binding oxidoreductase [Dictyobacter aurantiacus]|uniref:FAD-binding protein n=1 Tax=Dictyobacter aurantiacus TaxID=1936993 RepID=A0A401ZKJ6_9CHLR|nr:FAD-linked oxidase C-terminal domain-containing protein [Dictyobacter aurantiacus]GCE07379.1 FAD-binding protein [Dictyobacter aurantiacus]
MGIHPEFIRKMRSALPAEVLSVTGEELQASARDFWSQQSLPGALVRPTRIEHVIQTMRCASAYGVPVIPRAAGTNICEGFHSSPDALILDMRQFKRIKQIDAEGLWAVVEPGVINGALQAQVRPHGLFFPPDPASAQISTIGGNIATNAGGPQCLKYGVTTHHVQELTAVLADGSVAHLKASATGPDLRGLLIGSEGTLAVITEAVVDLAPLPEITHTVLAIFDRAETATHAVSAIIRAGITPTALEFFDHRAARLFESVRPSGYPLDAEALLLIDVAGNGAEVEAERAQIEKLLRGEARELRLARSPQERSLLWQGRIFGAQALLTTGRAFYIADTTVPRQRIHDMLYAAQEIARTHQLDLMTTGHAGDGNIHPVFQYDRHDPRQVETVRKACDELVLAALELGGTLTGEHGIGAEKRKHMHLRFTQAELAAQRALKDAFDPDQILNPGILLPEPVVAEPPLPILRQRLRDCVAACRSGEDASSARAYAYDPPGAQKQGGASMQINADNLTCTASAHVQLPLLQARLAEQGLHADLTVATHHEQTLSQLLQDDTARPGVLGHLLALKATLPDGASVRFGSENVKDVAGYDMKHLFIGSGDHFGRVEEITLQVAPLPHE